MDELLPLDGGRNFGLLTRATGHIRGQAVVLFNAGLIHRVGPFRFHVHLARRLASAGFDVFRFDMPRIGDAPVGTHATGESVVREVLDSVQAVTGARGFIVGGICSAADLGWRIAVADRRVEGLLLLDGMAIQNHWFRVGQLRHFLGRPVTAWPRTLARFLSSKQADAPGLLDFRDWPSPAGFVGELGTMLERGVRVLALYTGGISYYLLHRRQLDATFGAFRRHAGLQVDYWPDVDHILFSTVHRERVIEHVTDWVAAP